jgi:hypothetical protein
MVGYYGKGAAINIRAELFNCIDYSETFKFGDTVIGLGCVKGAGGVCYGLTGLFLTSLYNLHEDCPKTCLARIRMDFEGKGWIVVCQNWRGYEGQSQTVESLLLGFVPLKGDIFLRQCNKWVGYLGKIGDKSSIK